MCQFFLKFIWIFLSQFNFLFAPAVAMRKSYGSEFVCLHVKSVIRWECQIGLSDIIHICRSNKFHFSLNSNIFSPCRVDSFFISKIWHNTCFLLSSNAGTFSWIEVLGYSFSAHFKYFLTIKAKENCQSKKKEIVQNHKW